MLSIKKAKKGPILPSNPEKSFLSFSCKIQWKNSDWECTPPLINDKININDTLTSMIDPDKFIIKALEDFFLRFYPDEPKESVEELEIKYKNLPQEKKEFFDHFNVARLPWIGHQVAKIQESPDEYEKKLKARLEKNWLLSWHWRALLPLIKQWDERKENERFILQISQIRKWELLLLYKIESDKSILTLNDIKEKKLLGAPIFQESHRIFRWDVYRMFYHNSIKNHIKEDIDKLNQFCESIAPLKLAYILGRNDFYYSIDEIVPEGGNYRITVSYLIDIHPEKDIENIEIKLTKKKIKLTKRRKNIYKTIKLKITNPEDLVSIPVFSKDDNKAEEPISILLSSENYCTALSELTVIMNDPLARSILITAPPGSGKEDLAKAAFLCKETKFGKIGRFISTTLAGLSADEAARILFQIKNRNIVGNESNELDKNFIPDKEDGLYFKSLSGGLFIDEIDKTSKEVKSLLLRVLECNEVTIPDKSYVVKIPKEKRPLYIFTGSMHSKTMFEQLPIDFWTRISHVVEMSHPLDINNELERKRVIKAYLWLFWNKEVKDYFRYKNFLPTELNKDTLKHLEPQIPYFEGLEVFLLSEIIVDFVTKELSGIIYKRKNYLVSIRVLKNLVCRIIFLIVEYLLYSKSENCVIENLKKWRQENSTGISPPEKWFELLTEIIVDGIFKSAFEVKNDSEKELAIIKIELITDIQRIIRDGTASIL